MKAVVAAVLLSLAAASGVEAQPRRPEDRPRGGPARGREQAFKMIDAYIVSNLQESLGLTDEQFGRVLPLVKKLQTDRRAFAQKRFQALVELRRTLGSGSATEGRVAGLVKQLRALEVEEPAALRRDMEAIDGALTPLQQAKFRVLEVEVERRIRDLMARIRAERRGRTRSGGSQPHED